MNKNKPKSMAMDFRTEKEKERDARDAALCSDYVSIKKERNEVPYRIMRVLAEKYKLTVPGVRGILERHNIL